MASTNFKSIGAAAALALALSVGGVTAAGAETYTPSGEVSVSNPSPKAGSSVTFSGKTTPNTVVTVTISLATSSNGLSSAAATTYTLGSTTSDAEGFYSLSATIPADLPTGNYVVAASAGGIVISSSAVSVAAQTTTTTPDTTTAPDKLAYTGSDATPMAGVALGIIGAGGALVMLARRRNEGLEVTS